MRWKRLALLPALVLVYALVAEAGLHVAAFFMKRSTRAEIPVEWVAGKLRVLCLGDSNTYGLWLDRNEAYPQQLEAVWNERISAPKLEVLNLGIPGTNSSRLVRELPKMLETVEPDIVIIMIGVNDFWTLPTPLDDAPAPHSQGNFLTRHSLLYRLYDLYQRGRKSSQLEVFMDPKASLTDKAQHKVRLGDREFEMGFVHAEQGLQGDSVGLRDDLLRLVGLARDAKSPLYLMTYPTDRSFYDLANEVIRNVAKETGTPLIDLTAVFAPICPNPDCPDTLFPDGHPKAPGYRIVAETILERLQRPGSS